MLSHLPKIVTFSLLCLVAACSAPVEDGSDTAAESASSAVSGRCPGGCPAGTVCNVTTNPGDQGYCIGRPQTCSDTGDPVCGENGVTYANDCRRLQVGVAFVQPGPCPGQACGRDPGGMWCPPGNVCNIGNAPTDIGYCHSRPQVCSNNYEPVCGGDGVTYTNDCQRLQYGAKFDHAGECPAIECFGPAAGVCPGNLVCDIASQPGSVGKCKIRPISCGSEDQPVCGGNGVTYRNDCVRLQAGATFAQWGSCPDLSCGGPSGRVCQSGYVCDIPTWPGAQGRCVVPPTSCDNYSRPVCGGDNRTYLNNCYRLQAGVPLAKWGPC